MPIPLFIPDIQTVFGLSHGIRRCTKYKFFLRHLGAFPVKQFVFSTMPLTITFVIGSFTVWDYFEISYPNRLPFSQQFKSKLPSVDH
jgi:hypothetical protein